MKQFFLLAMMIMTVSGLSGCKDKQSGAADEQYAVNDESEAGKTGNTEQRIRTDTENQETDGTEQAVSSDMKEDVETGNDHMDAEKTAAMYQSIYDEMTDGDTSINLEVMRSMIGRFDEQGYIAVDEDNQIDMTGAEQVIRFCKAVDRKEEANLAVVVLAYSGGFSWYDFETKDGRVDVTKDFYQHENGRLNYVGTVGYQAESWQYTEEGYLLFGGSYRSESYYVLLMSDVSERMALRVQPLDEKCRELNRKYIIPVGYGRNNMFLTDWSEEDFGTLDFYDVFDRFYPIIYNSPVPYPADEDLNVRAVYQIAEGVFESVVMRYFKIDSEALQSKTVYSIENKTYEYSPRGFYESEYPDIPYPEVESFTENADGTISLLVNAVYPEESTACAFSHRVVVRPLEDGGFQYVSNEMLTPENEYDLWWHVERTTSDFPD